MTDPNETVLITGANRGIGFEFVKQYLARGARVFAGCRRPDAAEDLQALAGQSPDRCRPLQLDVADDAQVHAAAAEVARHVDHLDILVNNAGTLAADEGGLDGFDPERMLNVVRVNAIGPMLTTRAFRGMLAAASAGRMIALTSRVGVLRPGVPTGGQVSSYAISKAALHRAIPMIGAELRADRVIVAGMDPGWVATDMTAVPTGNRYQLSPAESVAGMIAAADRLTLDQTGQLWRWNGELSRWYPPAETPDERQELPRTGPRP